MKKLILLFALVLGGVFGTSSCLMMETTYTITNKTDVDMELHIYEYNELGNTIVSRGADFPEGKTLQYKADPASVDVKIYVKSLQCWVAVVFPLNPGANKEIIIEGETLVQDDEPMKY